MAIWQLRMLLRWTSVGWAVSTGVTWAVSKKAASSPLPMPASKARSRAWARLPSFGAEPAIWWARERRMWCWSSAMFDRCEK